MTFYFRIRCLSGFAAGLILSIAALPAAPIPGLYNTGVSDSGAILNSGSVDPHWDLIQSADGSFPGPAARVVNDTGFPIPPWMANGPDSKWIAPQANQSSGNQPGDYVYRITFDLTGLEPATAVITGRWSSDNAGPDVRLNGVSTGINYDGNFGGFSALWTIDHGFQDGVNTLDFVVNNAGTGVNPTGFRVELSGTADFEAPPGTPPSIREQPTSATVGLGDAVTLRVSVYGSKPLSYQWRRDGSPIAGADAATLVFTSVGANDAGTYDVVVTNEFGTATSDPATLDIVFLSPAQRTYEPLGPCTRRTGLVFSEIMYHPGDRTDGRNLEFIELYNSNPFFEDLSGYRLSGEVDYVIPDGTRIGGLSFLVVAPSPADIQTVYGITNVIGGFTNRLANNGGTLRLRKRSGAVILDLDYNDQPPWPVAADGAGHSMILARASYGERDPRAWAASAVTGGSPGGPDPIPSGLLENVVINEILAHTDLPLLDYVEIYNHSPLAVDVSGCWLSDDRDTNKFQIPPGTLLPPRGFAVFDEAQLGFRLEADGETVFLVRPDQQRVLDVLRFGGQANGVAYGRYPDGADTVQALAARTPGATNAPILIDDVVINEIMYHPISGDSDDEFLELYNQGAAAVDVGGWRFMDGLDFAIPAGTSIAAGGYLVVAKNAARLLTNYPGLNPAVVVGDYGGTLANGGETIVLGRPDFILETNLLNGAVTTNYFFVVVDEVTYADGGRWGQWSDGGGSSLELKDPRSDNRLPSNWADSDESAKAPWTLVEHTGVLDLGSGQPAGELHIHLQGPGEALVDDVEVFEVNGANRIPNGTFESGTSGWFFEGTQRKSSLETSEGYNSARSLHVRSSDRGDTVNRIRAPFTSSFPPNRTATIRAQVRWLRGHPEILFRMKENYLEAVGQLTVPANLGTPGAANSAAVANAGPAITEVTHRPPLPAANQPVRVFARIHDPDGVDRVVIRYRVDPGTTLLNAPMVDDGTGGDVVAGDGLFSGVLPGQPSGTLVAFRLDASDGASAPVHSLFPADAPERECLVRFGESVPEGAFGAYRIWMTQATFNWWTSRQKMSNEALDTTFVYGNSRVIYNTGSFFAGSAWSSPGYTTPTGVLCGYDVLYPDDDLFLGDNHVTLDWPNRDPSFQREHMMYWLLDQYDLPNLYRRNIHLFVNGTRRGALYNDAQQPGADILSEWFPNDDQGHLYKTGFYFEFNDSGGREGGEPNTLENFTTTGGEKKVARYRWGWRPRAYGNTANDFGPLFELVDALATRGSAFLPAVERVVDIDQWMGTFAENDLASYWDAFGNPNYKNTYLYKPRNAGWKLICWDFDVGLGAGIGIDNERVDAPLFPSNVDPTIQRLYNTPALVRAYWRALDEAVHSFFQDSAVREILTNKYQAFLDNGVNVTSPFVGSGVLGISVTDFITQRRAFILGQLAGVAADFAINGPDTLTTNANLLRLSGTAPVKVKTITVNGVPYPADWTSVTEWTLSVPLQAGLNALNFEGLDRFGYPVPGTSNQLAVTYTGTNQSPVDVIVINEIMYNPLVPGSSFVELYNTSTTHSFDLSGWRLNGLSYTFPEGAIITNGQYLLLAKDPITFGLAFGNDIPVYDQFNGRLENDGETLTLFMPGANPGEEIVVDRVTYDDEAPWPVAADGQGPSLQLIDPFQDNNRVSNWSDGQGWRFFKYTQNVGTRPPLTKLSFFFETTGGDIFLDDVSLVEGDVPEAGPNLLANSGFEDGTNAWRLGPLAANSAVITNNAHSGNQSLHLVIAPGPRQLDTFAHVFSSLTTGLTHTVSFWYKPGTNGVNFDARLNSIFWAKLTIEQLVATPGAFNAGTATLPPFPPVWISEVQPDNQTTLTDNAGEADPWIELYNSGATPLDLADYSLSDQLGDLAAWAFPPGAVLQPGEYRLVWADGQPAQSDALQWHASFRLNPTNGTVVLSRLLNGAPQIVDYLHYREMEPDLSFGAHPPGQNSLRQVFHFPTPGSANDPSSPPLQLFINEWMASNSGAVLDPADQDSDDWFEIYNPNDQAVDLAGYWLSDNPARPKYAVPAGFQIAPHGFLLIWADDEGGQTSLSGQMHVNFKLGAGGETIVLWAPDGRVVDAAPFGPQTNNASQGRFPDGDAPPFVSLTVPTPGTPNILITAPAEVSILSAELAAGNLTLTWTAEPNRVYRVEYADDLAAPSWTALPGDVNAVGATATKTDPGVAERTQRYYRIVVVE